jgi:hypothetical protein
MLSRAHSVLALLLIALAVSACSKCDMAGWLNSCNDARPKLAAFAPQYR